MEVMNSLFPLPMRAISRAIYGLNRNWDILPPSPIMQLSDEELALIFAEFVHGNHKLPIPDPLAAVILSHVCSWWRAVALSKSSLWASISDLPHSAVNQYLFRSGGSPLRLRFEFTPLHAMSISTALSVIERTHRCKELHWIDESPGCVLNVSAFTQMARFPVLEVLELASQTVVSPGRSSAHQSHETVLYPALRDLTLCQIHPAVLRPGPKPQLRKLTLKDLPTVVGFRVSHLLSMLEECPHLESLELSCATPAIDVHPFEGSRSRSSRPLPLPFAWRPILPIKKLILDCAPTMDLWRIFTLLNMPALESLAHLASAVPQVQRWPHLFNDDYSDECPDTPIEVPQLEKLNMDYDIIDPSKPLTQLAHLTFPNLKELHISYAHRAWDRDEDPDGVWFARVAFPPPPDQPRLFPQETFANLRRLALAHVRIDVPRMCAVLAHSARALELLSLGNCLGAGPLVCALGSPKPYHVCLHGHAHPLPPSEEGRTPEWLGLGLRFLVLVDCADVRIDCLRKVIESRAAAAQGVHDVAPGASWSSSRFEEHEAVQGWTPCRIETIFMERCAMVTEAGVKMLRSLADAPEFRFKDGRRYA
ncbi:hypothetical protein LXA43DRAFT_1115197 [Ganoderma leucocontextum]|nr:hypothetical protein LXA43DRAFT_1115197 [Ganoderma leucocontextum]